MRWLLAFALFLPLSGCLAQITSDASGESFDEASIDPVPRKGVVFFQATYQAVPQQMTEFQVEVPYGAQNVVFEISQVANTGTPGMAAQVQLVDCGAGTADWYAGPNIIIGIGGNWRSGPLCSLPATGARTLTIEPSLTPLIGSVVLRADLPEN